MQLSHVFTRKDRQDFISLPCCPEKARSLFLMLTLPRQQPAQHDTLVLHVSVWIKDGSTRNGDRLQGDWSGSGKGCWGLRPRGGAQMKFRDVFKMTGREKEVQWRGEQTERTQRSLKRAKKKKVSNHCCQAYLGKNHVFMFKLMFEQQK